MKRFLRSFSLLLVLTVFLTSGAFVGSVGYTPSQSPPGSNALQYDGASQADDTLQTSSSADVTSTLDVTSVPRQLATTAQCQATIFKGCTMTRAMI